MRSMARLWASVEMSPQASAITKTSKPWSSADRAGPTMHTLVHRPASTMRGLPISLTFRIGLVFPGVHRGAVQQGLAGKARSSSNMGPETLSATVVRMVEAPKPAAAEASKAALERSCTGSMECVAKAICDWVDHDQRSRG
jgi:hypothetical protein